MTELLHNPSDHAPVAPAPRRVFTRALLSHVKKRKYEFYISLWAGFVIVFWHWWFNPTHVIAPGRYVLASATLIWIYFLQAYFLAIFLNARRPSARLQALGPFRAAMVVTKAPSEPFAMVKKTLLGALAQDITHDTWLADEDPDPETIAWCAMHGVRISTRRYRPDYHRKEWPRRTRCKEGNLAFFYDHYGYDDYDFVAQLDADHIPQPGYLYEMLRPFADPRVGYVSAPSICASNADMSWAARARMTSEAMFHGVLQAGYTDGWAPMCIGSHYAVRTRALKDIGGLGPELAEDHSTSMLMNAAGWRGIHSIDALAVGAGPSSFTDMVTQEFQWSRSLLTILLRFTPDYIKSLRPRLRFQFLFSQLWYPLFAFFMAVMYVMPIAALVFDQRFANVTYPAFVLHSAPATIMLIAIVYMIRSEGLFRPRRAKVITWEKVLFPLAQWPWVTWGCLMAVVDWFGGRFVDYRITPKGTKEGRLYMRIILPYFLLALGAILPILLVDDVTESAGFYALSLINALLYAALFVVVVVHHFRENGLRFAADPLRTTLQVGMAATMIVLAGASVHARGMEGFYALGIGLGPGNPVVREYVVAGAGQGDPGKLHYRFGFNWD